MDILALNIGPPARTKAEKMAELATAYGAGAVPYTAAQLQGIGRTVRVPCNPYTQKIKQVESHPGLPAQLSGPLSGARLRRVCKYCGEDKLAWVRPKFRWGLYDKDGVLHRCNKSDVELKSRDPDDEDDEDWDPDYDEN